MFFEKKHIPLNKKKLNIALEIVKLCSKNMYMISSVSLHCYAMDIKKYIRLKRT